MLYDIGDSYVQWKEGQGWDHVKPQPKLNVTPSVSGSASFNVSGQLSVPSSLSIHVNQVFSQSLTVSSTLHMFVHGDTKSQKICAGATLMRCSTPLGSCT